MKKTIKGKLTLNTAIFIVAAIIVCEIVSVNALKTNMTNQTRQYVSREAQTNARVVNEWLQGQANGAYNYEYNSLYEHKRYGSRDGLPGKSLE